MGCSNDGYLKVVNNTDLKMESVRWGKSLRFGSIESGTDIEAKTDSYGKSPVFFTIESIDYRSIDEYEIDARTGATFEFSGKNAVVVMHPDSVK